MKNNRHSRKRIEGILISICLLFIFLTGCNHNTDYTQTTLQLEKDGTIIQTIVEEFQDSSYDFEELKQMNQEETKAYNESVSHEAIETTMMQYEGDKVKAVITYMNVNDYYGFNNTILYFGTIEQAKIAGYNLNVNLVSVDGQDKISPDELKDMEKRHIAIVNEAVDVHTYGKILYTSEDVTVGKNKKLATVAGEETAYIVFK